MMTLGWLELKRMPWRVVGVAAGLGALLLGVSHLLLPAVPRQALEVLEVGFTLHGLRAVLVLNDLLAVYTVVFFLGVALLHDAVVSPAETHELGIWLSKPVTRAQLLRLRATPPLAAAAAVGVLMSALTALSAAAFAPDGGSTPLGALLGGVVLTAGTVALLTATLSLQVVANDGFQAVLGAVLVWMLPLLPGSVLLYRPDVLPPGAEAWILPANLVRADAGLAAGPAVLAAVALAWVGMRVAAIRFGGREA
jgi:hypothetical protein